MLMPANVHDWPGRDNQTARAHAAAMLPLLLRLSRYIWTSPCSIVGLAAGICLLAAGGTARIHSGVVEVSAQRTEPKETSRFGAITLGHVILGRNRDTLDHLRAHELEHVRQYELWGLLFFLAYPASSLLQLMRGQDPYWDNHFEVQARTRAEQLAGKQIDCS
jgi:hypothetical protein